MDFYCYYKERFTWGPNPYAAVAQCQQTVSEMLENPYIPFHISAESAIDFLAALHDFAGDGCTVSMSYDTIMGSLVDELQRMRDLTEAADQAWCQEMLNAERIEGGSPLYNPGDYVVRDSDMDGDDLPDEPEPDGEPDLVTLEALYGVDGEPGTTGTRQPFPDWQHIDHWTQTDWLKLQVYKDKVLAAAEHDFFAMGAVTNVLAAAKDAMNRIPLPRQVELAMWATEIVDRLMFSLEDSLQTMCAGSLHSHEGRLVQKQLLSVTNGQSKSGPNTP